MAKPFDNPLKFLQKIGPKSYAKLLGIKSRKVVAKDTDLSTVSSASDCMLMIGADESHAEHIEYQASYDPKMDERTLLYNVLGRKALNMPVHSTVLLLRPEADGPAMSGIARFTGRDGVENLEFRFNVIRIWTIPAEELIKCGIGVLPLAFVSDIKKEALPDLVRRTEKALKNCRDFKPGEKKDFWTAVKLLMGLRYDETTIDGLLRGVRGMKESVTYKAILKEGEEKGLAIGEVKGQLKEARKLLLRNGTKKFGALAASRVVAAINAINSLERLEELNDRLWLVSNWDDLLKR